MPILLKKIKFLKYIVGKNKIRIDLIKIIVIKEWPMLINVKEVDFFFKFVNFNRNFIKGYLKYAGFLIRLIKKINCLCKSKNRMLRLLN